MPITYGVLNMTCFDDLLALDMVDARNVACVVDGPHGTRAHGAVVRYERDVTTDFEARELIEYSFMFADGSYIDVTTCEGEIREVCEYPNRATRARFTTQANANF